MDYDDVLTHLGEFGRYQKLVYALLWFTFMPTSIHINQMVILMQEPVYRCAVPSLANDTYRIQGVGHERLVNASIPFNKDDNRYSKCQVFAHRWNGTDQGNNSVKRHYFLGSRARMISLDILLVWNIGFIAIGRISIKLWPFKLNVPCDTKTYTFGFGLAIMLGLLVGSGVGGMASDYFGRKTVLIVSIFANFVLCVAFTFVTSLELALVLKFAQTVLGFSAHIAKYVLVVEITGPRYRGAASMATMLAWSIPQCLLALVYYLCQDWKTAQLILTIPFVVCIPITMIVPESLRWLLVYDRVPEAKKILSTMSRYNDAPLPDGMVDSLVMVNADQRMEKTKNSKYQTILKLFRDRTMVIRLVVLGINWGILNICYYGLSFNLGRFAGHNIYVALLIQGAVETAGFGFASASGGKLGRKLVYSICMAIGGSACLVCFLLRMVDIDNRIVNLVLFGVGKFGVGASFCVVFTATTELVPTSSRNLGLGVCSMAGRVLGILAPYIANLELLIPGKAGDVLPLAIFGVLPILAGISIYRLPETQKKHLPESIKDIKDKALQVNFQEQQQML